MTSDGEALFRAICEQPWEDTPRLAYADWLEENGDPARAEFIRAQCALAKEPDESRRKELATRAEQLHKESRGRWTRGSPMRLGVRINRELRRGFYNRVSFNSVAMFVERARVVFGWTPIDTVRVERVSATIGAVLSSQYLARLAKLSLSGPFGNAGCQAVAQCAHLARVTDLTLWGPGIGNAGIIPLAHSPHLTAVRKLIVVGQSCTDAGALALANSTSLARATTLYLHEARNLTPPVVAHLKQRFTEFVSTPRLKRRPT